MYIYLYDRFFFSINSTPFIYNIDALVARRVIDNEHFSSVALTVSRSALNADIDGISVTKRFHAIKYAEGPLRSITHTHAHPVAPCIFYAPIFSPRDSIAHLISSVTIDKTNLQPMLHRDYFKCHCIFCMRKYDLKIQSFLSFTLFKIIF